MAKIWEKKTYYVTAVGVLLAAIALLVAYLQLTKGDPAGAQTQTGNGQQAGGGSVIGDNNCYQCPGAAYGAKASGEDAAKARKEAEKYAQVDPPASRPVPFDVFAEGHLWVLSSADGTGHHIGAAKNGSRVFADCVRVTTFNGKPSDNAQATWLRIRWPSETASTNLMDSQPQDPYTGWVYSGNVVPSGHNGKLPACA